MAQGYFSTRFHPPGPAGLSFGGMVHAVHKVVIEETMVLLVISRSGSILFVLTAISYIKRRRIRAVSPFFFILAMLSGLILLVSCAMHLTLIKPRFIHAVNELLYSRSSSDKNHCTVINELTASIGVTLYQDRVWKTDSYLWLPKAQAIAQVEIVNLAILAMTLLRRTQTLFPNKPRVRNTARLLLVACGVSFAFSIALQIYGISIPWGPGTDIDASQNHSGKVMQVFAHNAYITGCLSFAANMYATWSMIEKWREAKQLEKGIGNRTKSGMNDPLRRLRILIYAGLLLGCSQVSYHIFYTFISTLGFWVHKDYVLARFLFHSTSALYPIGCYLALHWNAPSEDLHCIDLIDLPGDLEDDIRLEDLNITPTGGSDSNSSPPLIDLDM